MPVLGTGGTDGRFFRRRGVPAYGFGLLSEQWDPGVFRSLFHGNDERVDVESSASRPPRCTTSSRATSGERSSGRRRPAVTVTAGGRASRAVLRVCLATGFVTLLDSAILTVAAPALRAELGATTAQLQWILAGYSLTFGLALVPAGRLGDRLGRGGPLAVGLGLFAVGSLVGATASDADVLVAARLLQGAGAGTANPQVIGLLQDHYAGPARARALGAYASTGAFAMVLSPLVGGGILSALGPAAGWRAAVGLAAPLGLTVMVVALRALRPGDAGPGVAGGAAAGASTDGGAGAARAAVGSGRASTSWASCSSPS